MKKYWPDHRRAATAGTFAAAMLVTPLAHALTLGRAVVQSPLGESLRAEVEFENLSADEAESLRASIATAETYRQSGVEYNQALSGARVVLQRLANARPSLRITSDRAIQEPFVDLVLEITWRGGRLVRSYTLLFDLPQTRSVTTPAIQGPAGASPGFADLGASPSTPSGPGLRPRISTRPEDIEQTPLPGPTGKLRPAPVARRGPPPPGSPPAPALVKDPYRVRPGDSLSELAQRGPRPAGVSLDRLVLAMYRENPDAFLGGNMHRLRNGVVLSAPSAKTIDSITDAEARQVIRAQSADFNGYRKQLAAMPAERPETNSRRASGKIQAAVEDRKQVDATTPDKLTLSKPSIASAADGAAMASKQRERQDAATRVAELSKNMQDLGRLSGAVASSAASAAAPPTGPMTVPATAGASVPGGLPSPVVVASGPTVPAATAVVPPAASALQPKASAPTVRPPIKKPAPPPPPEPSLMDSLLEDNPLALGGAAAVIALLLGIAAFRLVKRKRNAPPETSFLESRLKPDSFFGGSGGQRIDTREVAASGNASSMMNYSLSQLDAIGDVDPVAEADVYLAYGRDLQAEEILKEAMRTTPERMSVRTKLLEVYAKRRDVKGFEQLAVQLHALTGGAGEDWAKAREMGHQVDPDNPLYSAAGAPQAAALQSRAADVDALAVSTLPQSILPPSGREARQTEPPPSTSFDLDLDLDLGMEDAAQTTMPIDTDATVMVAPTTARPAPLAAPVPTPPPPPASYVPHADDMVNFIAPSGFGPLATPSPPPPPPAPAPRSAAAPAQAAVDPASFSNSAFSLDLDLPQPSGLSPGPSMLPPIEGYDAPPPSGAADSMGFDIDGGDPLTRKLELADEFRQIGDLEGARDLLHEVISRAEGAVKAKAEAMLASLS